MITRNSPWRHLGRVPLSIWQKRITDAGGLSEAAEQRVWDACGDDSALMLAMLKAESSYASHFDAIPASSKNPWNLQLAGQGLRFSSIEAGAKEWRNRLYSLTYKGGIYSNTVSISDLIYTYAPPTDGNDTEGYIAKVVAEINRNGFDAPVATPATPEEPTTSNSMSLDKEPVVATKPIFGKVPHPPYQRRIVTNSTAWNDLGKRTIRAVVWHRMYGTLWGTDGYFRADGSYKALTDYGVGVAATDGNDQAGVILMWNDPDGRRAPWASGPAQSPVGDAVPFINRYGVNGVNRDAVSIEISGSGGTALDAKARAAVVALTAYYADQYRVPWDSFPAVPGEGRSFVMWHGEIYDGKRNSCPGAVVMGLTDAMIEETKAILKRYQTMGDAPVEPSEPVYAKPQPPAKGDSIVNERVFLAHAQTYTLKADVVPRIYADPGSDPTGPALKQGTQIVTSHLVRDMGPDADLTAVLADGSRIPVRGILV